MKEQKTFEKLHPFIQDNFKYTKGSKFYETKCPKCKMFYKSFMTGENSNPIELFSYIENCVKEKKEKGYTLVISCPSCNEPSAIDFREHLK